MALPGRPFEPKRRSEDRFGAFWGSIFRSKIDEKINAKIDVEKVMKNDEKSMPKCVENRIKIDRKFDRVRKRLNVEKAIKTNGFLMILWCPRLQNRRPKR